MKTLKLTFDVAPVRAINIISFITEQVRYFYEFNERLTKEQQLEFLYMLKTTAMSLYKEIYEDNDLPYLLREISSLIERIDRQIESIKNEPEEE